MCMKHLIQEVKRRKGKSKKLSSYAISRDLRRSGVEVTPQTIDNYELGQLNGKFLQVILGMQEYGGLSDEQFCALLRRDAQWLKNKNK